MLHTVRELLAARGIFLCAPIALSDCRIVRPYLLERGGITNGTAFLFAAPYYTTKCDDPARNLSAYAVSGDYHAFFAALFDEVLPALRARFPDATFLGFTDHSPINEVEAAVRAGLGVLGCNHLLLTERYSSYIFLGEIITDHLLSTSPLPLRTCAACGACRAACPMEGGECLSAITQKKGVLTEAEREAMLTGGLVWGCDRCQEVCPVTRAAKESGSIYTTIPYFSDTALSHLTADALDAMSDEELKARAFAWRGRAVIRRNLLLFEGRKKP